MEHIRARRSYQDVFYMTCESSGKRGGKIYGWPYQGVPWCNSRLKQNILSSVVQKDAIQYIGIAVDEPSRSHVLSGKKRSPLVEAGWTEADCRKWCEENGMLSPIYTTAPRGGCWFCHNQRVGQLRLLRKNYPELWALMLKWDADSPVTFHADGHTVHDFDARFALEDNGFIAPNDKFLWDMLNHSQISVDYYTRSDFGG